MARFLKKVTMLCALFLATVVVFSAFDRYVIGNQFLGNYQASLLDKVQRLRSIDEPKIILIGNSNVNFGFQSALIEEAFDMPTVNMGLHGGLGNAFHENMIKLGLSEGDIVVICHSSFSDDGVVENADLAWITLEHHAELWPLITNQDIPAMVKAYPQYLFRAAWNWLSGQPENIARTDTCYSRAAFNQYGDIALRPKDTYTFTESSVKAPKINDTCVNRLNDLNRYVQSCGATMLVAGYPIGAGEFTPDATLYDEFESKLRDSLNCDVISHYRDYFMPYDLFYNSYLHLTEEGAKTRTELFIQDLRNWMSVHQ